MRNWRFLKPWGGNHQSRSEQTTSQEAIPTIMVDVKAHQCFLVTMLDNLGVYTLGIGIIQDLGGHRFNMRFF